MNVLVTGAEGFIGSHLVRELVANGHRVVGIDAGAGDLRDAATLRRWLDLAEPDAVIHLAAKVGREFGEDDAAVTITNNAVATTNVARTCALDGVRLLYTSTSEVYGDQGDALCCEDGPLTLPHNLYGLSKRWGEEACQLYAPDDLTIIRLSMPYGPGLPAGRGRAAIVNFLDQATRRVQIPVHRGAERAWCWIGDTVRAFRLLLENGETGTWNVGRDDNALPMRDVARIACRLTGAPEGLIVDVEPPGMQTVVKRLSVAKLRELGWEPQVELEEGMALTLAAMQP